MNDDHSNVSLCKKGDLGAFEELVIKYQKKMLNIAFRMIGSYEDACEVVQDAFVSAYRHITDFEERSGFSTWLCSIVINLSRNRLKQIKTGIGRELYSMDDPVATESGFMSIEPASQDPNALEQLEKKELQDKVQDCIGRLDEDFRSVLILRDIQGFSYDEVGSALEINTGTVKSRLFRARDAMRDCLKKSLGRL